MHGILTSYARLFLSQNAWWFYNCYTIHPGIDREPLYNRPRKYIHHLCLDIGSGPKDLHTTFHCYYIIILFIGDKSYEDIHGVIPTLVTQVK